MSIAKWFKGKITSYFGLGDEKAKFLNNWFRDEILEAANISGNLAVREDVIEMLYKILYGYDLKPIFNRSHIDHNKCKLIIRTQIDSIELTISLDSERDNSIYVRLWTLLDDSEEENICFTIEMGKMSYEEVKDKLNVSINAIHKRKLNFKLRELNMRERQSNTTEDTDMNMSVGFRSCYLNSEDVKDINEIAASVESLLDSKLVLLNDVELEEVMDNNMELFGSSYTSNVVSQMIFQLRILEVILDYIMVRELKKHDSE